MWLKNTGKGQPTASMMLRHPGCLSLLGVLQAPESPGERMKSAQLAPKQRRSQGQDSHTPSTATGVFSQPLLTSCPPELDLSPSQLSAEELQICASSGHLKITFISIKQARDKGKKRC